MKEQNTKTQSFDGKVYITYHKPYTLLQEPFIFPIHGGRDCLENTKDGAISEKDFIWLQSNTIGDNTGINISNRNREYCELTALYWIWKNEDIFRYKYIGLMQYRRQFILTNLYKKAKENKEKQGYKCVHFSRDKSHLTNAIGLKNETICNIFQKYSAVIPFATELDEVGVETIYEDYVEKIPGVHIDDLILLEDYYCKKFPDEAEMFRKYLNQPRKIMYQMFIVTPQIFDEYCSWLFPIIFSIDKSVDTDMYDINGKRTLGYLGEILYGYYFTKMQMDEDKNVLQCGVTYLE